MKISKFLKTFTLIFIGILLLTSLVDAKSKPSPINNLTFVSKRKSQKDEERSKQ